MANDSFAFNAPNSVPTLQLGDEGRMRAGVIGGPQAQALDGTNTREIQAPRQDNTMALLMKVGQEALAPHLAKARTEAYISGMQRAMQGEAIVDIVNQQPWYTKIFGDSDVVEGARSYAGQTVAQTQVAAMEDKMPEIRKLDPEAARKYFINSVNNNLTGDHATDVAVLNGMTKALPAVMRRQAKEHYGYQQEQATMQEGTAFRAGAANLQAAAASLANGYTTDEEFAGQVHSFKQSLQPAAGRDMSSYQSSIRNLMVNAAQNGQFHALNAMMAPASKDDPVSLMDVLDADQRTAVEKSIETGEAKLRTKYSFAWNDQLNKIEAEARSPIPGETSTPGIEKQIDALNLRYQQETGSKSGLIPPSLRSAMVVGSRVAIIQEKNRIADMRAAQAEKMRAAGDKEAADAADRQTIEQRAADGSLGTLSANTRFKKEQINEVAEPMYRAMNPDDQVKFLVNNMRENYKIDPIAMALEGSVSNVLGAGGAFTPEVQKVFENYTRLREANKFTAHAYYGSHAAALDGFYNDIKNGDVPEGAFRRRFTGPTSRTSLSTKDMQEAVEVVNKQYNSWMPEWAGGQKLQPGTARRLASEMAGEIEQFAASSGNIKEATAIAWNRNKLAGREVIGGYTWVNGKGQVSLENYLTTTVGPNGEAPRAADNINKEFSYAVEELLYGKDGQTFGVAPDKASDVYVGRLNDKNGVPMFRVQSVVDGRIYEGTLAASDVFKFAEQRKKREANQVLGIEKTSLRAGPEMKGIAVPDDRPSIYASPEEWAKYRAKQ